MADLNIRKATVADAAKLYEWDKKPHVQAAVSNSGTTSFEADWEDELADRVDGTEFFIAEITTQNRAEISTQNGPIAIGAMQVIDPAREQSHYWGAVAANQRALDIWIGEEHYLGKGYGTQMMTYAIDYCFSTPHVISILVDPLSNNTRSHKFYERFGFVFVERRQFDEESDCFVYKLTRSTYAAGVKGQLKSECT